MNVWPRALSGPVMNMARPPRPPLETQLVREAESIVRSETPLTSARAISREIARRVGLELLSQAEADPVALAFAAMEGGASRCPFQLLATDPDIDTIAKFIECRVERVRSRDGRYLPPAADAAERRAIVAEMMPALAARYDWQLRSRD